MSYQLTAWAVKQRTGSATRKTVLMALTNCANHHTNSCEPLISQIVEETELSDSSVRRALNDLEGAGLIARKMRHNENGHRVGYVFSFPHLSVTDGGRLAPPSGQPDESLPVTVNGQELGLGLGQEVPEQDLGEANASPRQPDPPKLVRIEGRDIAFDALAEVCGVDPNGNRAREVGIALNGSKQTGAGIRALVWPDARAAGLLPDDGERFEQFVVGAIHERARQYQERMGGAMLTPLALAKWWTDIAHEPPSRPNTKFGRRDVSAAEMLAAAERLEQNERKEIERATE